MVLSGFFQKLGFGGGYAQGTGKSSHGPVPPDPEEEGRYFEPLPVEVGDVEIPKRVARLRQFARLQQPVGRRRFHAAVWVLQRKISRLHRSYPLWKIAVFYLLLAGLICVIVAGNLFFPLAPAEKFLPVQEYQETPDEAFARLSSLMSSRDFAGARMLVGELEAQNPDDIRLLVSKGIIAAANGDSETALVAFTRADRLKPGSLPIIFNLAETVFFLRRYAEAETQYRRILLAQPGNLQAIFRLYLCTRLQKKNDEAARMLRMASASVSSIEFLYIQAADALFERRTQEGKQLLEKAHSLFGNKAAPYDKTLLHLGLLPAE